MFWQGLLKTWEQTNVDTPPPPGRAAPLEIGSTILLQRIKTYFDIALEKEKSKLNLLRSLGGRVRTRLQGSSE